MKRTVFLLVAGIALAVAAALPPATTGAAPEVAPTPKPVWTPVRFSHPVVFTIALDNEPQSNARLTVALANRLTANGKSASTASLPVRNSWVVPGGAMTLRDFTEQCAMDPNTVGAFVILPTAVTSSFDNGIVLSRQNSEVFLNIIAAQCTRAAPASGTAASPAPAPSANPLSIVWASTTEHGVNVRTQVEFFPIAILLSTYLALAPQRTTQTTTVISYPTVVPIPPGGERTQVQQLSSNVLNAQGNASLQSGVLTAFAGNGIGTTIGAAPSPEKQNFHALDDAIGYIVRKQINVACAGPQAASWPFCSW